mgnify:FL=1
MADDPRDTGALLVEGSTEATIKITFNDEGALVEGNVVKMVEDAILTLAVMLETVGVPYQIDAEGETLDTGCTQVMDARPPEYWVESSTRFGWAYDGPVESKLSLPPQATSPLLLP